MIEVHDNLDLINALFLLDIARGDKPETSKLPGETDPKFQDHLKSWSLLLCR